MRFTIYGKNMHVSEGLKETLKKKLGKFDRYFGQETEVYATFSKEKNYQMLEVTIPVGKTILRAEERSEDMVTSIEDVVNKLKVSSENIKRNCRNAIRMKPPNLIWKVLKRWKTMYFSRRLSAL